VNGSARALTFAGSKEKILLFIVILKTDFAGIILLIRVINELEDIFIKKGLGVL
jgi:hypothetical protein